MRSSWRLACLGLVMGCGSGDPVRLLADSPPAIDAAAGDAPAADAASLDAAMVDAALPDAMVDAAPTCPTVLLVGGMPVGPQGWSTITQGPATVSDGPDYVQLETTTTANAITGGQLLLDYPGAFDADKPFKLQVVLLVESVDPHDPFDAAAAIMGSFHPTFGLGADRSEMIYLDSGALGWADDTQTVVANIHDGAYHTYELAVDAGHAARVTIDGTPALTRSNFVSNGTLAIGDQTNEAHVDSVMRIRSVTKLCP